MPWAPSIRITRTVSVIAGTAAGAVFFAFYQGQPEEFKEEKSGQTPKIIPLHGAQRETLSLRRVIDLIIARLFAIPGPESAGQGPAPPPGFAGTVRDRVSTVSSALQAYALRAGAPGFDSSTILSMILEKEDPDGDLFAFGALLAASDFANDGIKEASPSKLFREGKELPRACVRGFIWACAACYHTDTPQVSKTYLTLFASTSPKPLSELIPSVAVFYEPECLRIFRDIFPLVSGDTFEILLNRLIETDARLATKGLKLLPAKEIDHFLLQCEPAWIAHAGEFLEFVFESPDVDLLKHSRQFMICLLVNHTSAAGKWAVSHWGQLPPSLKSLLKTSIGSGDAAFIKQVLASPPVLEEKEWAEVQSALVESLALLDTTAFAGYLETLPAAQQEKLFNAAIDRIASFDPARAASVLEDYAGKFPVAGDKINLIADGLAVLSPGKVDTFLASLPEGTRGDATIAGIQGYFRGFRAAKGLELAGRMLVDPAFSSDATTVKKCLDYVAVEVVQNGGRPAEAIEWAKTLPTQELREQAALSTAAFWLKRDPNGAAGFLLNQPGSPERTRLLEAAATEVTDPAILRALKEQDK